VSKVTILLSYLIILRVILYCIHHIVFLDDQTWGLMNKYVTKTDFWKKSIL